MVSGRNARGLFFCIKAKNSSTKLDFSADFSYNIKIGEMIKKKKNRKAFFDTVKLGGD